MRQLEITFTPHEISWLYKFLMRLLIGFSPWIMAPWTPHFRNHQLPAMLLTWDYTSEMCRSSGGGAISWLTTPFRAFSLMSTANDFWREREGRNFWSCWLSFSRHHISMHLLNILTNILFKYDTVTFCFLTFCFLSGHGWPQKRPVYEFPHGIYDVIFLWRHYNAVIMTSYFCDVILTPLLWRPIFVTSF
jgi:hypothetical protein